MSFKTRNRRAFDDQSVDMTPMLDIVFIMLIFFIVTAVFLDEGGLNFVQPDGGDPAETENESIQIYVDSKDRVSVDSLQIELSAIPARVERLLAEKPEANIILTADQYASLDPLVYIQDQMNLAQRQTVLKIIRD